MTLGGPDWQAIIGDTRRGMARYWPLLLAIAAFEFAVYVAGGLLLGEARSMEAGAEGYASYLALSAFDLLPSCLIYAVGAGVVMNGLSERPVGRGTILDRSVRAMPAAVVAGVIGLSPYLVSNLVTYSAVDAVSWWGGYAAGLLGLVALMTVFGFITLEAIARGSAPMAAVRGSAELTRGHRNWLGWLFLGMQVFYAVVREATQPLDGMAVEAGVTALGLMPVSQGILALLLLIGIPLDVAIYLELRRLQAGEIPGVGATFD